MAKKKTGSKKDNLKKTPTTAATETAELGPTETADNENANHTDAEMEDEGTELNGVDAVETRSSIASASASATANAVAAATVLEVDPELILEDPILRDLRDWQNTNSPQQLALPELARTIYEEGQDKPVGVFETEDGYVVYDGHRRRRAVMMIREEDDATFPLRVIVNPDMTLDKAIRLAMLADSQQEGFTASEQARNIRMLRKRFGWEGEKGTEAVASFLGVSKAGVIQAERLAQYPELMEKVDSGQMTTFAALETVSLASKLPAAEREKAHREVTERAQEIAEKEQEKKKVENAPPKKTAGKGKKKEKLAPLTNEQKRVAASARDSAKRDKGKKEQTAPKIESSHVRQAAKEVLGDQAKTRAPKMSDAISLIGPWAGPAYPKPMMKFAATFEEWAHGKATDKVLEAAWDDIADALAAAKPKSPPGRTQTPASATKTSAPKKNADTRVKTPAKSASVGPKPKPVSSPKPKARVKVKSAKA